MAQSELVQGGASEKPELPRRSFLTRMTTASLLAIPASLLGCKESEEENISTNEDLMREHGILKRVLLTYDEVIRRIHSDEGFSPQAVTEGATIVRKFVEDYHEKLEEESSVPALSQSGKTYGPG